MKCRTLAVALILLVGLAAAARADEAALIAVLQSPNASREAKSAACRELSHLGTKKAVPALAALLGDEKLSDMARYALEPIRDPSVDEALQDALGKLKGRQLIGVIGSLGVRRDTKAVEPLGKLLASSDVETAQAAARALGNIGNCGAQHAVRLALRGAPKANRLAMCEGLLRAAEALRSAGVTERALSIYKFLQDKALPPQVRAAASRGEILVRAKEGIPLLLEALRGSDNVLTTAAARTAMEMPGNEVTAALCNELPALPEEKQVLVIQVLGARGDAKAGPALATAAAKGAEAVRIAAVQNLARLKYDAALPLLAKLAIDGESKLATTARTTLADFPGTEADAPILAMTGDKDAKLRALAIETAGKRSIATPAMLLKAAGDADSAVRIAALAELHHVADVADLPALLDLLAKVRSSEEIDAAEEAISALCAREKRAAAGNGSKQVSTPPAIIEILAVKLSAAHGGGKIALLHVLRSAGGENALQAVAAALSDNDAAVREEACSAAVAIAEKLAPAHDHQVAAVMRKVAEKTSKPELAARAKSIAQAAEKR